MEDRRSARLRKLPTPDKDYLKDMPLTKRKKIPAVNTSTEAWSQMILVEGCHQGIIKEGKWGENAEGCQIMQDLNWKSGARVIWGNAWKQTFSKQSIKKWGVGQGFCTVLYCIWPKTEGIR